MSPHGQITELSRNAHTSPASGPHEPARNAHRRKGRERKGKEGKGTWSAEINDRAHPSNQHTRKWVTGRGLPTATEAAFQATADTIDRAYAVARQACPDASDEHLARLAGRALSHRADRGAVRAAELQALHARLQAEDAA